MKITRQGCVHTDAFTLSGDDRKVSSRRCWAAGSGGIVVEVGEGVTSLKPGDHVIPLYTAEWQSANSVKSGKTNLCRAVRTQVKG